MILGEQRLTIPGMPRELSHEGGYDNLLGIGKKKKKSSSTNPGKKPGLIKRIGSGIKKVVSKKGPAPTPSAKPASSSGGESLPEGNFGLTKIGAGSAPPMEPAKTLPPPSLQRGLTNAPNLKAELENITPTEVVIPTKMNLAAEGDLDNAVPTSDEPKNENNKPKPKKKEETPWLMYAGLAVLAVIIVGGVVLSGRATQG